MTCVWADFNGLFGDILCLSHKDISLDPNNAQVTLQDGMAVTAYMEDADEHNNPEFLVASGIVRPSPRSLQCYGSRWVLEIDDKGVRHVRDLPTD
jgi:hypothetical protein